MTADTLSPRPIDFIFGKADAGLMVGIASPSGQSITGWSAEEVEVIRAFGEVMIVLAIVLALMLIEA